MGPFIHALRPGRLIAGIIILIIGIAGYSAFTGSSISESEYQTREMAGTLTDADANSYFIAQIAGPIFGFITVVGIGLIIYGIVLKGKPKVKTTTQQPQEELPRYEKAKVQTENNDANAGTVYCTSCGKKHDAPVKFCSACGKKLA